MSARSAPPPVAPGFPDLVQVKGQEASKRALEVAAAGDHGILLVGPPGSGKTLLARCLPGILPPPAEREAAEIAETYRRAGLDPPPGRPFRAPPHGIRPAELIGRRRPGELELAHGGALFLDDLPAFGSRSLRALRAALEGNGAEGPCSAPGPAVRLLLVAAMRPCPCGLRGDWRRECVCPPWKLTRYWSTVEAAVADLFQVHAEVPCVTFGELESRFAEPSARVAERVREARERQLRREGQMTWNAHLPPETVPRLCEPDKVGRQLLETAYERLALTPRTLSTVLRVARTIADLAGSETVRAVHVAEALQYRSLAGGLDRRKGERS